MWGTGMGCKERKKRLASTLLGALHFNNIFHLMMLLLKMSSVRKRVGGLPSKCNHPPKKSQGAELGLGGKATGRQMSVQCRGRFSKGLFEMRWVFRGGSHAPASLYSFSLISITLILYDLSTLTLRVLHLPSHPFLANSQLFFSFFDP